MGVPPIIREIFEKKRVTWKSRVTLLKLLVRPTGIEPVAYNLGGCRSIQLSYERNPNFVVIL